MDRRSAMIIAGTLVAALMAGIVSREVTLSHPTPGPIQVVQTSTVPAAGTTAPAEGGGETGDR
jgi:hypothetical protein